MGSRGSGAAPSAGGCPLQHPPGTSKCQRRCRVTFDQEDWIISSRPLIRAVQCASSRVWGRRSRGPVRWSPVSVIAQLTPAHPSPAVRSRRCPGGARPRCDGQFAGTRRGHPQADRPRDRHHRPPRRWPVGDHVGDRDDARSAGRRSLGPVHSHDRRPVRRGLRKPDGCTELPRRQRCVAPRRRRRPDRPDLARNTRARRDHRQRAGCGHHQNARAGSAPGRLPGGRRVDDQGSRLSCRKRGARTRDSRTRHRGARPWWRRQRVHQRGRRLRHRWARSASP